MNKNILALAVLGALAGAAQAQSSVTVYGSFDGGVRSKTNVNAAGDSVLTMSSNGQYYSNRLGFLGAEDLGGGLKANFKLETGFNTGTGALDNANNQLFNRSAWVGLSGDWGQVNLGRQYTVAFFTVADYDPFNYKFTGIIPLAGAAAGTRFSNDVQYTGTFGAFKARAEYAFGEVAGNTGTNSAKAIGVSYGGDPVSIGAAYTNRDIANFSDKNFTIGGAFKSGGLRVALGYIDDKLATASGIDSTTKNAWGGLSYQLSPQAQLTGAYYQTKVSVANVEGKKKLLIVGATYALSKRTNFYADIDNVKLSGSSLVGTQSSQTGISLGINHLF